jgi:tetratricopeptide (TPR) repeat protein
MIRFLQRNFLIVTLLLLSVGCKQKTTHGNFNLNLQAYQDPAVREVTEKLAINPDNSDLYFRRGLLLHRIGADTLAIKDFKEAIHCDSSKAEYYSAIGDLMFEHKDISGSFPFLKKAIDLNPKDPTAHLKVAKLLLFLKDYKQAFYEINIVLRQNSMVPEGYFLKGMIYKDMKDTTRALSSFLTTVQVDPNYKDALQQLGLIYGARNDSTALKYFENAFRADTTDVFPLYSIGKFFQDHNQFERAKKEYTNCVLHDPNFSDAYFNIGWILMHQDSLEKAWRHFDIVTRIEPTAADAYYNRGLCSEMMNRNKEALEDYNQALVFDKNYKEAQNAVKRLSGK